MANLIDETHRGHCKKETINKALRKGGGGENTSNTTSLGQQCKEYRYRPCNKKQNTEKTTVSLSSALTSGSSVLSLGRMATLLFVVGSNSIDPLRMVIAPASEKEKK